MIKRTHFASAGLALALLIGFQQLPAADDHGGVRILLGAGEMATPQYELQRIDPRAVTIRIPAKPAPALQISSSSNFAMSQTVSSGEIVLRFAVSDGAISVSTKSDGDRLEILLASTSPGMGASRNEVRPVATAIPVRPSLQIAQAMEAGDKPAPKNAPAAAAETSSQVKGVLDNLKQYSLDLSVPESPAFAILGASPQDVIHPTSIRELGASLVNGVSKNGQVQTGLAIDTAPFLLIGGDRLTLTEYRSNRLARLLANTQLSLATVKANNDESDKGSKVGVGLHMNLYDRGDPRLDQTLSKCYQDKSDSVFTMPPISPKDPNRAAVVEGREKILASEFAKCRKEARDRLWNRTSWLVGTAGSWTNEGGVSQGMRSGGSALWTTFAYGFEGISLLQDSAQFLLHGRHHDNEVIADKTSPAGFLKRDSNVLGARLRMGSESGSVSIETSYTRGRFDNGQSENVRRFALGGEMKIKKDLWLVGSIGGEGGFRDGQNRPFALGSLKFGSGSEPQFDLKGK